MGWKTSLTLSLATRYPWGVKNPILFGNELVCKGIDDIVDAQFIGLVGKAYGKEGRV